MIRRLLLVATMVALTGVGLMALAAPRASAQAPQNNQGYARFTQGLSNALMGQFSYGGNTLAAAFEAALQRSRDEAHANSHPVPKDIREALAPFYSDELLAKVRYSVGDTTPAGVAGFAIRNGNAAAVTLIDTIVFKDDDYVKDLALWAHEMHHVEQYRDWGVSGFASRYIFGWQAVEDEASAKADEFVAWYKKRTHQSG